MLALMEFENGLGLLRNPGSVQICPPGGAEASGKSAERRVGNGLPWAQVFSNRQVQASAVLDQH